MYTAAYQSYVAVFYTFHMFLKGYILGPTNNYMKNNLVFLLIKSLIKIRGFFGFGGIG